jgi:ketosteroid isomerase-like protein
MTDVHLVDALEADRARCAATLSADLEALEPLLHPTLSYVHSNGVVDDRSSYLAKVASSAFRYASLEHDVDEQRLLSPDHAVLLGRMTATGTVDGKPVTVASRTLSVWGRDEAGWRLMAFQSTRQPG